jgi:GNAT superfamily N-acetyltransferase
MTLVIHEESPSALDEYARVPIAFETHSRIEVLTPPNAPVTISERLLDVPLLKDYDALEGPRNWSHRFDVSRWTFFGAYDGDERVGGAVVIMRSPEIQLLDGRDDLALLWDIRVAPHVRRTGVGAALMRAVKRWATSHGASQLKVETQDVNPAACRFYERQGFVLVAVNRQAYAECPDETQLLWSNDLVAASKSGSPP